MLEMGNVINWSLFIGAMARETLCDIAIGSSAQFDGLLDDGKPVLAFFHMDGDVWRQAVAGLSQSPSLFDYLDRKGIVAVSVDVQRNEDLAALAEEQNYIASPHVMAFDATGKIRGESVGYIIGGTLLSNLVDWYGR